MLHHDLSLASGPRGRTAGFTPLERRVIALARRDAPVSGFKRRSRDYVSEWLFANPPPRPLANERLEALRRLASDLWHGQDAVRSGNLLLFRSAGFDDRHLSQLQDLAGAAVWEDEE